MVCNRVVCWVKTMLREGKEEIAYLRNVQLIPTVMVFARY